MSRALILSGGAFRGAIQVPVIEYLKERHEYDEVYGVSVGSINGAMFAQDQLVELRELWDSVDGVNGFLSHNWYWPFNGWYSMKPLRKKLEKYTDLELMKVPFYAGIVSFTDGEYRNLSTENMKKNKELWDAIQASSCMAGIMIPEYLEIDGKEHLGVDGGFRSIIPTMKDKGFDYIDVVTCTPLDRMLMKEGFKKNKIFNLFKYFRRSIEIFEDEIFDKDIMEISNFKNTEIRVFSPSRYPGDSLAAKREDIEFRYELGKEAIKNPLIINPK